MLYGIRATLGPNYSGGDIASFASVTLVLPFLVLYSLPFFLAVLSRRMLFRWFRVFDGRRMFRSRLIFGAIKLPLRGEGMVEGLSQVLLNVD